MTDPLEAIVKQAQVKQKAPPRDECLDAVRQFAHEARADIQRRHSEGMSGHDVVAALSRMSDKVLHAVFAFALAGMPGHHALRTRISLCALGGYGRHQLNPYSDLDIALVYEGAMSDQIREIGGYLVPFLWDAGFHVGFAVRSTDDSLELARHDIAVFTSILEGRHVVGDNTVFARLKLLLREQMRGAASEAFIEQKLHDRTDGLSPNAPVCRRGPTSRKTPAACAITTPRCGSDDDLRREYLRRAVSEACSQPTRTSEFMDGLDCPAFAQ